MRKTYQEKRDLRLPVIKALYLLGFSADWIAQRMKMGYSTVRKDIKFLDIEKCKRPKVGEETYRAALKEFARRHEGFECHTHTVAVILGEWFEIKALRKMNQDFSVLMKALYVPKHDPKLQGFVELLSFVFDRKPELKEVWDVYFEAIEKETIPLPSKNSELKHSFSKFFADCCRGDIGPIWSEDVEQKFQEIFSSVLTPREEEVLKLSFGIGREKKTLKQIADIIGVGLSPERMRQIFLKAVRRLSVPSVKRQLEALWRIQPVSKPDWTPIVLEDRKVIPYPLPEIFTQPVAELDFSVRTANCMKNSDIRQIVDLVQKTDWELLRTQNFGRKSLAEVKEVLEKLGLQLGMRLE